MKPKHTPPRSIRVPDALWQDAKAAAGKRDETLTHAITDFLRRYVKRHHPKTPTSGDAQS